MPKNEDEEEVEVEEEEIFDEDEEDEEEDDDVDDKDEKDLNIVKENNKKLREKAVQRREKIKALKKELKKASTKEIKVKVKKELEDEKKKGLDRVDRYFLRGEGIKTEDEIKLVEEVMSETGKSAEQVVDLKYFQTQLKELRDAKETKEATPSGSKRSGQNSTSDVDYWLAKGGLPKDNPELARKVVNARMKKTTKDNQFSDTPVIS